MLGLALLALTGWVQPSAAQDKQIKRWSGEATPELKLKDVEGRFHDLREYRGKVVLVNFWATWCEPCRDELPSMMRLRQRFAGRPFEVLAVDAGEGEARVKEFLQKMPLSFPVLLDTRFGGDAGLEGARPARVLRGGCHRPDPLLVPRRAGLDGCAHRWRDRRPAPRRRAEVAQVVAGAQT
ncbi:MAG: TlpA family protein disulfide reductase [Comamonadaceae bacterium]|nr:TlpA family protein disulfide reductase [Comamonadaceae bacterium]